MSATPLATASTMPPVVSTQQGQQLLPQLAALVQRMPAAQQAQALAELQQLSPAQQQALLAEVQQAQAKQTTGAAAGATQAATGATMPQMAAAPSLMSSVLKNAAIFGGVGAALGFGATFMVPVIGQLGGPVAAAIGGGIGAVLGAVKGFLGFRKQAAELAAQQQAAGTDAALSPPGIAQTQPTSPAPEPAAAAQVAPIRPPRAAAPTDDDAGAGDTYTVRRGDTLSAIARRHGTTWQRLYAANHDAVGPNPNLIHPGLKLELP